MTERRWARDGVEAAQSVEQLQADDQFLTHLSQGVDPTDGQDPLARLFLDARAEIQTNVPQAPTLAMLGLGSAEEFPTGELAPVTNESVDSSQLIDAPAAKVIELPRRRWNNAFAHALVGAAAATLIIAGGGTAIYNAGEGSALYALNQKFFGQTTNTEAVVALASKLDQANDLNAKGDKEGARQLLEQARELVNMLNARDRAQAEERIKEAERGSNVAPVPPPAEPEASSETVVTTMTTTVTETVTVEPTPARSTSTAPSTDRSATSSTSPVASTPSPTPAFELPQPEHSQAH
ncbi:hypothetical protein AN398_02110 [Corynebacterium pseudotuberculosis]|uniref:hypothetical protein n=1 Tax=Corynebacterium pseudotuberculosis TaxID=1719 RepID=UPI000737D31C|nr:hypothetical protein [Corynebacterium pseudotuberculosis]ALU21004.1 hypothetical protein AN398_02110 [Corynebacterium pseudotuberculosis]ANH23198.1 Hypothetical protein CpE55_0444 [Corynebacterium pseudotuberculosis]